MAAEIVGPDVSKAWLDGCLASSGRRLRVGNDAAGIRELVRALGDRTASLVVMEASGGYERAAHRELVAQGVLAAIVNPKRVRDFARGMGLEAKTDRVDAKVIARYGAVRRPAPTPVPAPARAELGEILACRRQLIDEITVREQQLEHLQSEAMRGRVTKALAFLRQEAKELTKLLRRKIHQADEALAADCALLTSMPGCGPILAATLLAEMPELGALDRRKVAALAGLAPVARDSGLRENRRVIKGGRGQVRRALYMAAVASLRIEASPLKRRYGQLTAKGKAPKLALTALMRQMLVTLNAMLRARQPWKAPA
ncbi:MAG TPA: IS110 family transposase [Geminicoccaceae bacterium]|jgi:transposase|nr:IS110 family transposase [Geminicoccaceae bacterium]